jgi:hypothetical protein
LFINRQGTSSLISRRRRWEKPSKIVDQIFILASGSKRLKTRKEEALAAVVIVWERERGGKALLVRLISKE